MVDLLKQLEPLEIATKELSGDKYSSLSLVIPILTQLHVEIAQLRFIDSTVKEVKQKLVDTFPVLQNFWIQESKIRAL